MATLSKGYTFGSTELVTNTKLHSLVDDATIGDITVLEAYSFRVGRHTEVHFNDSDYEKILPIIKDCATRNLEWLGWFHSHPFKRGDHIYMSNVDVSYQYPAQIQNPFWTAIVCNPHQIKDRSTTRGMRAFRLYYNTDDLKLTKKVIEIPLIIEEMVKQI